MREFLYKLKKWAKGMFVYPSELINLNESLDYDEYWENKRGDTVGTLSEWQKQRADIVCGHIGEGNTKSIGDMGCGEGSILKYLKEKLNLEKAVGYDSSERALEMAKSIGIEGKLADVRNLGEIEKCDYYVALEVIEHVPDSEKLVSKLLENSDKGVFISIPNSGFFTHRFRMLFGKFPLQWTKFPNEHLRFWTATDMKWWLKAQGYTDSKVYFYEGMPILKDIFPNLFAAAMVVYIGKN